MRWMVVSLLAGSAFAGQAVAETRRFDIPAQPLPAALSAYAQVTGARLAYLPALAAGRRSPGATGALDERAALDRLLAGTGLLARQADGGAVTLQPAPPPAVRTGLDPDMIELPGMDVQARTPVGNIDTSYSPPRGLDGSRTVSGATNMPVPLIEQPRSVSVVTPERIQLQQPNSLQQIFNDVSSVVIPANGEAGSGGFLNVRGLDAARFLVDGVSSYDFIGGVSLYGNIERAEVYNGPSAFLQGATNLGGTVNFVTKKPLQTPQYTYNLGVGFTGGINRPQTRGSFDLTSPITDTLSYRAIGQLQYDQGYESPAGRDSLRGGLSLSALWRPTGDTSVLGTIDYYRGDQSVGTDGVPANGSILPNRNGISLPYNQKFSLANLQRVDTTLISPRLVVDHQFDDVWSISGGVGYSYSKFERVLSVNTSLAPDDRTLNRLGIQNIFRDNEYTARVSVTGKFNVLNRPNILVAGADTDCFVFRNGRAYNLTVLPIDIVNPVFVADPVTARTRNPSFRQTTFQNGVFVNDRLTILPHVDLFGGARVDRIDVAAQTIGAQKFTAGSTGITSNAGVSWEFIPGTRAYYGYSEAFAAPVTNYSVSGQIFPAESGNQHEVGIKTIINDRLTVQGSLFRIARNNVLTPDPNDPLFSVATGAVHIRGGEVEAAGKVLPGLQATAAYTFLDPVITRDNDGNAGRQLANVPRHSLRLFATYEFPETSQLKGFGIGGGLRFNGASYADNANTVKLPQFAVFDALAYKDFGRYRLQANVYNLTDEHYYPSGRNAATIYAGQPLSALLSLQVR